jgi:hypothetical protein
VWIKDIPCGEYYTLGLGGGTEFLQVDPSRELGPKHITSRRRVDESIGRKRRSDSVQSECPAFEITLAQPDEVRIQFTRRQEFAQDSLGDNPAMEVLLAFSSCKRFVQWSRNTKARAEPG